MEFKSLKEAFEVFEAAAPGTAAGMDALAYILAHLPQEMKDRLSDMVRAEFPHIKPDFYDDQGTPYWTFETIADGMGIPEEDRGRVLDMLKESPQVFAEPEIVMHRRQ